MANLNAIEALRSFRDGYIYNRAGGVVSPITPRDHLDRVLILGTFDNTYYASGREMTSDALERLAAMIRSDGRYVVDRTVAISRSGRAPSNDPALLVLALALSVGDPDVKAYAAQKLPLVARTGTHLMTFLEFATTLRGWGRTLKRAVSNWFTSFTPRDLAYQAIKYQNRGAWSLRRALCDAHVRDESDRNDVLHWIVYGWPGVGTDPHPDPALRQLWAYERLKRLPPSDVQEAIRLIIDYRLPREAVPTHFLAHRDVWAALLVDMPMTALMRNLATLTRVGVLEPLSDAVREVVVRLTDPHRVRAARLHPLAIAVARATYIGGRSIAGASTWTPIPAIVEALDTAFELAFPSVTPTNKRIIAALDVSGSMSSCAIPSLSGLRPADAGGIMLYAFLKTEPNCHTIVFDDEVYENTRRRRALVLHPSMSFGEAITAIKSFRGGGTDVGAPIRWALDRTIEADAIVIFTDNETWANSRPIPVWMNDYRRTINPAARLIVAGMTATDYSVVSPNDALGLNVAGFDTNAPGIISNFIRGFDSDDVESFSGEE